MTFVHIHVHVQCIYINYVHTRYYQYQQTEQYIILCMRCTSNIYIHVHVYRSIYTYNMHVHVHVYTRLWFLGSGVIPARRGEVWSLLIQLYQEKHPSHPPHPPITRTLSQLCQETTEYEGTIQLDLGQLVTLYVQIHIFKKLFEKTCYVVHVCTPAHWTFISLSLSLSLSLPPSLPLSRSHLPLSPIFLSGGSERRRPGSPGQHPPCLRRL